MSARPPLTAAALETAAQFTTSGALTELVDRKVLIVLRDNRKITGVLRSYDQYANLVLERAVERFFCAKYFAEAERGIYLVRGENVVLLGEVDLDLEDEPLPGLEQASVEQVTRLMKEEDEQRQKVREAKGIFLMGARGFSEEHQEGDLF